MSGNESTVFERLKRFVKDIFKTNIEIFFEALKLSPNAQGYVGGSITELLLKRKLEGQYNLDVKRIREKWEGKKHFNHHGDFYFSRAGAGRWYVLESKGVKSNSEKWHKLYNYSNLKSFLVNNADKIEWVDLEKSADTQVADWIQTNLSKFSGEYSQALYEYEEVLGYDQPKKPTPKSKAVALLRDYTRDQINGMIRERLLYVMGKVKVLETHFVAGASDSNQRTLATPRKDEFNIISVDIFLRDKEHRFLFANPKQLDSSESDANHLQQNYVMGFVFPDEDGTTRLNLTEEWYEDFNEVFDMLDPESCVRVEDMQVDNRNAVVIGIDEPIETDE